MDQFKIIAQSIEWRKALPFWGEQQALRLFSGSADGIDGLIIEKYGPFVLATLYCYHDAIEQQAADILKGLDQLLPTSSILVKARLRPQSNEFFYLNNERYQIDAIYSCLEGQNVFEVHCNPRHDYGLYLDTKAARGWVSKNAQDKRVLNLFSYTCAFAVAASSGGATEVVNIDPAKEYLDWGGRNAELNHTVYKRYADTTQDYLARHLRRLESEKDLPYQLTIVDPPAFLVGRGDERLARKMWPEWMEQLKNAKCQQFLMVFNDKDLARNKQLEVHIRQGLGDQVEITALAQSPDVLGQGGLAHADRFYYIPEVFIVTRS